MSNCKHKNNFAKNLVLNVASRILGANYISDKIMVLDKMIVF